jgi:hypothetical protein
VSAAPPVAERQGPAETVAGFLAALAIFGGLIAIAQRPVTIGLTSLAIALIAATMAGGRNRHLAAAGVAVATMGWLIGMIVSVITSRPLW